MYVIGAYLLSANVVKITMIRKCSPPAPLQLLLEVNQSKKLAIPLLQHSVVKCPWFFAAKCDFVGYFALTSGNKEMEELISRNNKGLPQAFLLRTDKPLPQVPVPVKLHDARVLPDGPRKHKLAVCLQPVYLLADWTLLVQFFEIWIAQGATKFYMYIQSMAPEVDALLRVYEHSSDLDVERVEWGSLPTADANPGKNDPNLRMFRMEAITSINDCLLRSRGHAKYVAIMDLDEIVVTYTDRTVLEMLERMRNASKNLVAFIFRSSFVHYKIG
ncbi:unnamed protein product [Gongylonema pulchrum]|uniref:Glycosyltransferase family 92 protein n=1 Tax=Gongylonema pulchrum TaxID=637853 RepID=A0A183E1Z9_9BILA|nr:unnamed protein product [Gongylonema pulchrum]